MKNKKYIFSLLLFFPMLACPQIKDSNKVNVKKVFKDWQQASSLAIIENFNEMVEKGTDSLSIVKNTLPIFRDYITASRAECFNAFKENGLKPFKNLYYSDFLIFEIFREDHCHTKVMHIIVEKEMKKYSFVRSCITDNNTKVYEEKISGNFMKFGKEFVSNFEYKGNWRLYTGMLTFIKEGSFKSIALLYLTENDVEKLNEKKLGLQ